MAVELRQHVICGQLLDHAHELLDSGCHPFSVKHGHQIVYQRLLVRQGDQAATTLILQLGKHFLLFFTHSKIPLHKFRACLQIQIFVIKQVLNSHFDHALQENFLGEVDLDGCISIKEWDYFEFFLVCVLARRLFFDFDVKDNDVDNAFGYVLSQILPNFGVVIELSQVVLHEFQFGGQVRRATNFLVRLRH